MRILSIDYGEKRVGLACCDETATLASPLEVAPAPEAISRIKQLVEELSVQKIILGLPRSLSASTNPQEERVRLFAQQLEESIGLKPIFVDERFSSQLADQMGATSANRDAAAAAVILQQYLDHRTDED